MKSVKIAGISYLFQELFRDITIEKVWSGMHLAQLELTMENLVAALIHKGKKGGFEVSNTKTYNKNITKEAEK